MSKRVARFIENIARLSTLPLRPQRRALTLALLSERLQQSVAVVTARGRLLFNCPTSRALHDPLAFWSGEPETLGWIDRYVQAGDIVWDIGANIGVYTLYAAQKPRVRVVAFEPSAASYAALVRNIELNHMGEQVSALCIALARRTGVDYLHMAHSGAGHSMHAFGQLETVLGPIQPVFSQAVPGLTIDDVCAILGLPPPDHVKLDVDGTEAQILDGGRRTLPYVRTIAMEVQGELGQAAATLLQELGFVAAESDGGVARNCVFLNPQPQQR